MAPHQTRPNLYPLSHFHGGAKNQSHNEAEKCENRYKSFLADWCGYKPSHILDSVLCVLQRALLIKSSSNHAQLYWFLITKLFSNNNENQTQKICEGKSKSIVNNHGERCEIVGIMEREQIHGNMKFIFNFTYSYCTFLTKHTAQSVSRRRST